MFPGVVHPQKTAFFAQLFLHSFVSMSVQSWMQSPPQRHQSYGWCLLLVLISRNRTQINSETRGKIWKQISLVQHRYPGSRICVCLCVCVWDCLVFSSSTWYTAPSALLTVWAGSMATFLSVWDIQQVSKSKPGGWASRLGRERLIFAAVYKTSHKHW